jgi:serine/threonine-protein kinase
MGSPSPEDPRIGLVLNGRYRITHRLGEGGMGIVYRGERLELQRPVAIKFLHSPYARSPKFVSRFQREARAMSRLSHPCLVSVIDFGVHEAPYIVMDFVTGATLRDIMDDGRVAPQRAIQITRQILSGLAHAHGQGVVHRDVKPGNIMLGEAAGMGDHVRIFDFGLAKLHDPGLEGEPSMVGIVGTPCYMAPEQARGDKVDARADLYAVGIVLFEMLAGQKPFDGEDSVSILRMQRDRQPPKLRSVAPELSSELELVVSRALEKDLMKRFQTAAEFLDALEHVPEATGRSTSAPQQDKSEDPVAFAETQQVSSPRVESTSSYNALESTARRSGEIAMVRVRRAIWLFGLGALIGVLAWRFRGGIETPRESAERAASSSHESAPSRAPLDAPGEPTANAPSEPGPTQAEPSPTAEPTPTAPGPAPSAEEAGLAPSNGAPEASTGEADDLSEDALAAADRELEQSAESEPVVEVPASEQAASDQVSSVRDVQALIDAGHVEAAINGIRRLRRQQPDNPQLPFMLAELYFKRGWWTDALSKYRETIRMRDSFKARASLQKNVIEALGADKTYARARALIVRDIGRSIAPRLRTAARSNPSDVVRKRAKAILKRL